MAYGFKVVNQSTGSIQIDENYKNLAFKSKHTVDCTTQFITGQAPGSFRGSLSVSGTSPVVAISAADYACLRTCSESSGTWTFVFSSKVSQSITVYVFDIPPSGSLPSHALLVKDASGNITFRSDLAYMRVTDFVASVAVVDVYDTAGPITRTQASGRTYAVMNMTGNLFGIPVYASPDTQMYWYSVGSKVSSNTVYLDDFYVAITVLGGSVGAFSPPAAFLVVDVTGL